jgi:cyclic pyranopterin phosphate synthase
MDQTTHIQPHVDREANASARPPIIDQFGRTFNYLRIAVNEKCNLRCIYCMPEEGVLFKPKNEILTTKEILRVVKVSSELGVNKIRFTGGEPLLRGDIVKLVGKSSSTPGIESIHLTTNGVLLSRYAGKLKESGLTGVNISIDTLNSEKFLQITRRDELVRAMEGLEAAKTAGIPSIKINAVALRGFNDSEIVEFVELTKNYPLTVRFIELMPFDAHQIWKTGKFFSAENIQKELKDHFPNIKTTDGTATEHFIFQVPNYAGKVAVIPSYSRNLCGNCNRIRLTADGNIRNCLYAHNELNLRDLMRSGGTDKEMKELILSAMWKKQIDGWTAQKTGSDSRESMTQIGG